MSIVPGFEDKENECVSDLLHGIPKKGGSATKQNFEMLVRSAFQGGLFATHEKMAEFARHKDEAIHERDACHKCWDDFTAKIV